MIFSLTLTAIALVSLCAFASTRAKRKRGIIPDLIDYLQGALLGYLLCGGVLLFIAIVASLIKAAHRLAH